MRSTAVISIDREVDCVDGAGSSSTGIPGAISAEQRALLERSWAEDFWISDPKGPGDRGPRLGWQMPGS